MAAGVVEAWAVIAQVVAVGLVWFVIGERLRSEAARLQAVTLPGLLGSLTGSRLASISGGVIVAMATVAVAAGVLGATGRFFESFFDISPTTGLIAVGAVVTLYTAAGGFKWTVWTDLLFAAAMAVALVFLPLAATSALSSQGSSMSAGLADFPELGSWVGGRSGREALGAVLAGVGVGFAVLGAPHTLGRIMAIRDSAGARRGRWVAVGIAIVAAGGATIIGISGISLYNILDLRDPQRLFGHMAGDLGGALSSVALVAPIAAGAAVLDALVISGSATVSEDLVRRDAEIARRVITVAFGAVAIGVALYFKDGLALLALRGTITFGAAIGVPLFLALLWRRVTGHGVACGMWFGFVFAIAVPEIEELKQVARMEWIFSAVFAVGGTLALRLRGPWIAGGLILVGVGRVLWPITIHGTALAGPTWIPVIVSVVVVVAASLRSPKRAGDAPAAPPSPQS